MEPCILCDPDHVRDRDIGIGNDLCVFIQEEREILPGSGLIIPRAHRRVVFDLTEREWTATFALLAEVKQHLDEVLAPDGYNVGWNCERVAGQTIDHAHLHVLPRFRDEPYATRGIRYWLKQDVNRRASLPAGADGSSGPLDGKSR